MDSVSTLWEHIQLKLSLFDSHIGIWCAGLAFRFSLSWVWCFINCSLDKWKRHWCKVFDWICVSGKTQIVWRKKLTKRKKYYLSCIWVWIKASWVMNNTVEKWNVLFFWVKLVCHPVQLGFLCACEEINTRTTLCLVNGSFSNWKQGWMLHNSNSLVFLTFYFTLLWLAWD